MAIPLVPHPTPIQCRDPYPYGVFTVPAPYAVRYIEAFPLHGSMGPLGLAGTRYSVVMDRRDCSTCGHDNTEYGLNRSGHAQNIPPSTGGVFFWGDFEEVHTWKGCVTETGPLFHFTVGYSVPIPNRSLFPLPSPV